MPSSADPRLPDDDDAPRWRARALRALLGGALVALGVALLLRDGESLDRALSLPLWVCALVVTGKLLGHALRHLAGAVAVRALAPDVPLHGFVAVAANTSLLGRLAPMGAASVAKALLLERLYGARRSDVVAGLGAALAVRLVVGGLVGGLVLLALVFRDGRAPLAAWSLVLASVGAGASPFLLRGPLRALGERVAFVARVRSGLAHVAARRSRLWTLAGLELVRVTLAFADAGLLLYALVGERGAFVVGGLMNVLTLVVGALPTGGLGAKEWAAALVARAFDVDLEVGLAAGLLGALLGLIASLLLGAVGFAAARRSGPRARPPAPG